MAYPLVLIQIMPGGREDKKYYTPAEELRARTDERTAIARMGQPGGPVTVYLSIAVQTSSPSRSQADRHRPIAY
jgi:hypothetical protein